MVTRARWASRAWEEALNKWGVCCPRAASGHAAAALPAVSHFAFAQAYPSRPVRLADPKIKTRLADLGANVLALSPADFGRLIADEIEKWGKVIRAANIKPQ